MTLVLDANIAIALVVPLPYSNPARSALAGARRLIAPDLLVHETANVVSKLAGADTDFGWESALDHIHFLFDEFVPCRSLAKAAVRDAVSTGHSAYDMFYLALARERAATLVTADRKLAKLAESLDVAVTAVA